MSHITQEAANELFNKIRKHKFHDTLDSNYARRVTMLCNAAIQWHIDSAALAQPEPAKDPCPGCRPGGVCRTPTCGRLKLPVDHPLRSAQPEPVSPAKQWVMTAPDGTAFSGDTPLRAANQASKYRLEIDPVAAKKFLDAIETIRQEGEEEHDRCMKEYGTLNCPACGGSGHIGDVTDGDTLTVEAVDRAALAQSEPVELSDVHIRSICSRWFDVDRGQIHSRRDSTNITEGVMGVARAVLAAAKGGDV